MLPFSAEQFFDVFAQYNTAIWPVQVFAVGLGAAVVVLLLWRSGKLAGARSR